ncbi:MAG: hypothetical protein IJA45_01755 [Oscillospiraceae bacterium]|nr:hypothetical protein [Bacteroidaceae bacterium]MBQ3541835.1 hypothetical protein [Oscillospiraceae bacterium]
MAKSVVTVIGMGDRITGKNRETGKTYDFRKVAFSLVNIYGSNDVSINIVDGNVLDELDVQIGKDYIAAVNQVKKVYYIDLIDEA